MITRRGILGGMISFIAAPAIVRASSLMPVKAWAEPFTVFGESDLALVRARIQKEWLAALHDLMVYGQGEFRISAADYVLGLRRA